MATLGELVLQHPEVRETVMDPTLGHAAVVRALTAAGHQTSERSVRRVRRALNFHRDPSSLHTPPLAAAPEAVASIGGGKADITSDTVTFHGVVLDMNAQDADDWGPVFKIFGLNPDNFEIVDDTVKISTWQQSKGTDDGQRDKVQLWAHSARFRKVTTRRIKAEVLNEWRSSLIASYSTPRIPAMRTAFNSGTYTTFVADPQLGKKGTEEAVENWKRGVEGHCDEIARLSLSGMPPEAVHVAFMGDETEGVCNNYTNQPHTVELNLTAQLELDFDLRMWTLRRFAEFGLPMSASSVISNHGEWTRNGSKDVVTTRGDNASTHIARQVKKVFDEMATFGGPTIEWTIGTGEPGIIVPLSGVRNYMSHGYIEKGRGSSSETRTRDAMQRQIIGRTEELGGVQNYFVAHYHHFYSQEWEGRTQFGLPALEAEKSSEYMRDQYGVWSPPGMLGLCVGSQYKRGWTNLNVF